MKFRSMLSSQLKLMEPCTQISHFYSLLRQLLAGPETNDIMLVKLAAPSIGRPLIQLNTEEDQPAVGLPVTAIGFGRTVEEGDVSETLKEVQVNVIAETICSEELSGRVSASNQFCAGVPGGGKVRM